MAAVYDVTYADRARTMVLKADLNAGWEKRTKTFGFFRVLWVWYKDLRVRTQLALIAQPATFAERAAEFPGISLDKTDQDVSYHLSEKNLTINVPLLYDPRWWKVTPQGRPIIYLEQLPLFGDSFLAYDLRVWIVFHTPLPAPIPDVRVWCQRLFVPGGQFESNRRTH